MSVQEKLAVLREDFELFDDPRDRFSQLMDIGKNAPPFPPEMRIEAHRVIGCSSQAWLIWEKDDDGTFILSADSDAFIVKGLLTILTTIFSGEKQEDICNISGSEILESIGLEGSITSQRTNGFVSALNKIQKELSE